MSAQSSWVSDPTTLRHIAVGVLLGIAISQGVITYNFFQGSRSKIKKEYTTSSSLTRGDGFVDGVVGLIGMSIAVLRTTTTS